MVPKSEFERRMNEERALEHIEVTRDEFIIACETAGLSKERSQSRAFFNEQLRMFERIGDLMMRIKL